MGQPVKLSDELVDDARAVVPFSQRSIAGQIEFWAGLGKSIEPLLRGDRALSMQFIPTTSHRMFFLQAKRDFGGGLWRVSRRGKIT